MGTLKVGFMLILMHINFKPLGSANQLKTPCLLLDWKYRKEDSKWLGGCTSVQEHCTVLAGLRDKEAARGRPADWSETSAGGESPERDIPKKQKGGLFSFFGLQVAKPNKWQLRSIVGNQS